VDNGIKKGAKRVENATVDNKRQITAIFTCTLSGNFLPIQLIKKGNTTKCHPKGVPFPADWHITHTENHRVMKRQLLTLKIL